LEGVGEVFLGQGKYALEILKRSQLLDFKPLATIMVSNLKLTCDEDFDLVDPTLYRLLIRSLMYLVKTRPNICYADNAWPVYG
jgi:hypothetical protein